MMSLWREPGPGKLRWWCLTNGLLARAQFSLVRGIHRLPTREQAWRRHRGACQAGSLGMRGSTAGHCSPRSGTKGFTAHELLVQTGSKGSRCHKCGALPGAGQ